MSRRQIDWPTTDLSGWVRLKAEQFFHTIRQPVLRTETTQNLCTFFCDRAQLFQVFWRNSHQLLGVKWIVQWRMMKTVFLDRPGIFNIRAQPHHASCIAKAFAAKVAKEILIFLDVQRHTLKNVERDVWFLQQRRIFPILFQCFQLQPRFGGVSNHEPVTDRIAQSCDALGIRSKRIHSGFSFLT